MSKEHLRTDKECANCGYAVDVAYCSKCGQKNTETRQPFHHLFTHFVEDLTHYDGAFWKTIKYLLFRPGKLTRTYLEGHRQAFVPPVKLYIFISFITFVLMGLMASTQNYELTPKQKALRAAAIKEGMEIDGKVYHSTEEFEKYQASLPEAKQMSSFEKVLRIASLNATVKGFSYKQLIEGFLHATPKVLFIYMPVFAFWLWLLHGKKRWYFFDHGIFTLHYFSFLLLALTIYSIINFSASYIPTDSISTIIKGLTATTVFFYSIFYFFRAHRIMYGEKRWISRFKGVILFFINMICFLVVLSATIIYILYNIH